MDRASSSISDTAALPIFVSISRNLVAFIVTNLARLLPALAEGCSIILKNLPSPSAHFVLPLTIIFFLLHSTQLPIKTF